MQRLQLAVRDLASDRTSTKGRMRRAHIARYFVTIEDHARVLSEAGLALQRQFRQQQEMPFHVGLFDTLVAVLGGGQPRQQVRFGPHPLGQ